MEEVEGTGVLMAVMVRMATVAEAEGVDLEAAVLADMIVVLVEAGQEEEEAWGKCWYPCY